MKKSENTPTAFAVFSFLHKLFVLWAWAGSLISYVQRGLVVYHGRCFFVESKEPTMIE